MNAPLRKGQVVGYVDVAHAASPGNVWHIVQISDGLDNVLVDFLKRLEIVFYQPLIRVMKPVPRKALSKSQRKIAIRPMREKVAPFFPGYAFIDYSRAGNRWREIFQIAHIRGLVCAGNMPVQVPNGLIRQIKGKEVDGAVPGTLKISEFSLLIGERVLITDGPLSGFSGQVQDLPKELKAVDLGDVRLDQLDESFRVKLLVNVFGRHTPLELSLSQITKL